MLNETEIRNAWKCLKTQRTMSLTTEAWNARRACHVLTSRSEVLEILIRHGQETNLDQKKRNASLLLDITR